MEIILDNVYYESKTREENINNISYTFKNSITFVSGISLKLIKDLDIKKPLKISIYYGIWHKKRQKTMKHILTFF